MENSSVKLIKGQQRAVTQGIHKGIRVAAYCRVSTDGEEQLNSFSSQVKYKRLLDYSEKIKSKEQEITLLEKLESKQAGIHDKLLQFRNVIANNFQINTFDRDVCDVILDKIIVGGYDENGNKIPYQVTIVFDIECSREINTDKDYFVILRY